MSVNQIEIRLRPCQLNALLDVAAAPIQGVIDDETEIVFVPIRLRRAGREIRMVIDGTDPFATSKPDARLIKLLLKARRFNATLVGSDDVPFAALAKREGVSRPISLGSSASAILPLTSPKRSSTGIIRAI